MKIAIPGTGIVGRTLAGCLIEAGHEVIVGPGIPMPLLPVRELTLAGRWRSVTGFRTVPRYGWSACPRLQLTESLS